MTVPSTTPSDVRAGEEASSPTPVRLVACNGRWHVMVCSARGWTRRGELTAAAMDGLRRSGRLRQTSDGSWELLPPATASSGDAGQDRPGFNAAESPLAWLRTRKDRNGRPLISEHQYVAGERLRADFERAQLTRRVTTNWDIALAAGRGSGHAVADPSDHALAARQRFHKAMDAVGPELGSILWHVCCMASGLEQAERLLDLPQRSGKAILGLALTALARHYGLTGSTGGRRSGHWGLPDYRPAIPEPDVA